MGNQLVTASALAQPDAKAISAALNGGHLERLLNRGRFYESLLVQFDDGRREVVKLLAVPTDLDLLQVHLDDLAEINHRLMDPDDGIQQLVIPSQVDLFDRTVIVRRPFIDGCLAQMFSMLLVDPGFDGRLDILFDGRVLEDWQLRWIGYQLVMAVRLLHQAGLVHGSLQTSNVLIDSSLTVSLVDTSPYKPFCLGSDDPTALLYYYDQEHVRYVAPERFDAGAGSDLAGRQRADVYGLAVILRHLFGPTDAVNTLMESRNLLEFPPLFPSSALESVVLPLIRHWSISGLDFDQFSDKLDDLKLLWKGYEDIAKILCQFLIGQLQKAKDEAEMLRILSFVRHVKSPNGADESLVFYLEAVRGLGVTAAITTACDHILGHVPTSRISSRSGTSTGQMLRSLLRSENMMETISGLYPGVLIHPSEKVRRAAIKLLSKFSSSSHVEDVDKLALINRILAKALIVEQCWVDPALISYDGLAVLLKTPLSQDLYELVQRNIDQLPLFMSALSPEDAEKVKHIAPLLKRHDDKALSVLTRKVLKVNPVLGGLEEDHAAFSPVLSDVGSTREFIPIGSDPQSSRHFQRRRLPFQFSEYQACACSPTGEYFALISEGETEVWRAADFRREILPEPWLTVPVAGPCTLKGQKMAVYSEGVIVVFNLERNTIESQTSCDADHVAILSDGLLVCANGLTMYTGDTLQWRSESRPVYHGYINELLVGPGEIFAVTTTSNGYISLWDLRYGLCLRSWRLPLSLAYIHGASLCCLEDDADLLLPPRIWVLCSTVDGRPCLVLVDLSVAQITHSNDKELEADLLEDAEYPMLSGPTRRLPFCHPDGAEWVLFCDESGQIYRGSLGPETIDMEPLHTSIRPEPIQSIGVVCPTSAESSRNLSLMMLTLTGQSYIIECFK